ncbi:MAG: zinc dependent phospholipase C family protein [Lachnospiraceae bacterium]|nr:zinc dependent phospholipase C family protein [Lachnospiraceae bacterium]
MFFSLISKKGAIKPPDVGHLLHTTKTGEFILALIKGSVNDPVLKSYTLGYLSHYGTDTIFHPYIYTKSFLPDGTYSGDMHCTFEHVLDAYTYRKRGHETGVPTHMLGFIKLTSSEKERIAGLFSSALVAVHPEFALTRREVVKSFSDAITFCRLLKREGTKKFSLLISAASLTPVRGAMFSHIVPDDSIENICSKEGYSYQGFFWDNVINEEHNTWRSYWEPDTPRNEGYAELYTLALSRGSAFISSALGFFSGAISIDAVAGTVGDMSFDSGLPWDKTEKIKDLVSEAKTE